MKTKGHARQLCTAWLLVVAMLCFGVASTAMVVFADDDDDDNNSNNSQITDELASGESWEQNSAEKTLTATICSLGTFTKLMNFCVQQSEQYTYDITIGADIVLDSGGTIQMASGNYFIGTFDGGDHMITLNGAALFREVGDGSTSTTIKNVNLAGSVTVNSGDASVGALACELDGVTVSGCTNNASVTSSGNGTNIGGLVGAATGSTLTNCVNHGTVSVSGGTYVGGLVGAVTDSTLTSCTNNGTVDASGNTYVGGLVASASGTVGITSCTNAGDVKGGDGVTVGTFVGAAASGSTVTLTDYTNTGALSGSIVGATVGSGDVSYGGTTYNHVAGTAYTFPSDAKGVTNSAGATDGCVYTPGVTYYVATSGNYNIA